MLNCISLGDYIGIIATLIGVCAVFVTVAPVVYDKRYKRLEKRIKELEELLSPEISKNKRSRAFLDEALKNSK